MYDMISGLILKNINIRARIYLQENNIIPREDIFLLFLLLPQGSHHLNGALLLKRASEGEKKKKKMASGNQLLRLENYSPLQSRLVKLTERSGRNKKEARMRGTTGLARKSHGAEYLSHLLYLGATSI